MSCEVLNQGEAVTAGIAYLEGEEKPSIILNIKEHSFAMPIEFGSRLSGLIEDVAESGRALTE